MDGTTKESIATMLACYKSCTRTILHCLEMGGEHAGPQHINLLMDCAKICEVAADFAIRGSANHPALCGLCADICRQCAEQCEEMAEGDEQMQKCAEACRQCAEACGRMSQQ